MFSLETPRLILRDLLLDDLKPFFKLGSDPEVARYQHYICMLDEKEALDWLSKAIERNNHIPRNGYNLAIIRKGDLEWIGWFGFGKAEDPTIGDIEFGYAISRGYWGNGYASEALYRVIGFCFKELGVNKIYGECDLENPSSARVMIKEGLQFELTYQEVDETTGKTSSIQRYSI